uniref:Uncharacterized protein n=1 Tax=Cyanoderma ruficeps TaxID=181631 RepID=A0A8C3RAE7_9PASS
PTWPWTLAGSQGHSSPSPSQAPLESLLPKEPVIPVQPQETPHGQWTPRDVPTITLLLLERGMFILHSSGCLFTAPGTCNGLKALCSPQENNNSTKH